MPPDAMPQMPPTCRAAPAAELRKATGANSSLGQRNAVTTIAPKTCQAEATEERKFIMPTVGGAAYFLRLSTRHWRAWTFR